MIPFNLPILISSVFVLGFQIIFFFDSVFGRAARKPQRFPHVVLFALLTSVYLTLDLEWFASGVALLLIYSLADTYQVELKNKLMFTVLYGVLMSIVNFLSIFIFIP